MQQLERVLTEALRRHPDHRLFHFLPQDGDTDQVRLRSQPLMLFLAQLVAQQLLSPGTDLSELGRLLADCELDRWIVREAASSSARYRLDLLGTGAGGYQLMVAAKLRRWRRRSPPGPEEALSAGLDDFEDDAGEEEEEGAEEVQQTLTCVLDASVLAQRRALRVFAASAADPPQQQQEPQRQRLEVRVADESSLRSFLRELVFQLFQPLFAFPERQQRQLERRLLRNLCGLHDRLAAVAQAERHRVRMRSNRPVQLLALLVYACLSQLGFRLVPPEPPEPQQPPARKAERQTCGDGGQDDRKMDLGDDEAGSRGRASAARDDEAGAASASARRKHQSGALPVPDCFLEPPGHPPPSSGEQKPEDPEAPMHLGLTRTVPGEPGVMRVTLLPMGARQLLLVLRWSPLAVTDGPQQQQPPPPPPEQGSRLLLDCGEFVQLSANAICLPLGPASIVAAPSGSQSESGERRQELVLPFRGEVRVTGAGELLRRLDRHLQQSLGLGVSAGMSAAQPDSGLHQQLLIRLLSHPDRWLLQLAFPELVPQPQAASAPRVEDLRYRRSSLPGLPVQLLAQVSGFLRPRELAALARCCSRLSRLVADPRPWAQLLRRDFPGVGLGPWERQPAVDLDPLDDDEQGLDGDDVEGGTEGSEADLRQRYQVLRLLQLADRVPAGPPIRGRWRRQRIRWLGQ